MSRRNPKWIAIAVALLAIATLVWWGLHKNPSAKPDAAADKQPVPNAAQTTTITAETKRAPERLLQSAAGDLAAARDADGKKQALARLREALVTGSTNETLAAIRQFLNTKTDAATGQGFKLGGNGSLSECPTLRTFLLDQLAQLDPTAAATYSREILNASTSPDEWAVALRNLARGDASAEARALLVTKTGELLRNESWQRDPSVGYLEAFDTAVHLGGTDLLAPLSDLVRKKDNQAVAHAAFLTLDRLTISQPAETLAVLAQHPEWMQGREETRANYFARADVGEETQRRLVESYVLDATRSPQELATFAGVFPNANFMISQNLLTANVTLDGATLRQRDQVSLAVVTQWLSDPRFEQLKPQLVKIQQRLQEFVRQAK